MRWFFYYTSRKVLTLLVVTAEAVDVWGYSQMLKAEFNDQRAGN